MIAQLPHKLRRLAEMRPPELGHRVRESARRGVERAVHRLRGAAEEREAELLARLPATVEGSALRYLREQVAARTSLATGIARRDLLARARQLHGERLGDLASEAEALLRHRVELLGHGEIALGDPVDWHRDPVTHELWPRRFWADYDLVHDAPSDPKRILELNRHQHLPRLAKAGALLDDERFSREAVAQLVSWIDQNPRGSGVHWHESLELALRAVSWIWTLTFLAESEALDEAAARRILASLFAQLDHVATYPSLYSSPNTHLLGEAAALFQAGALFRDSADGERWLEQGRRLLENTGRQVLSDGVHAELSTAYHCYALDFCLQSLAVTAPAGVEPPAGLAELTRSMARFLREILNPDGTLPLLGDDDGGRALALAETSYRRCEDLLCTAAVLLDDPTLRRPSTRFAEETLWLLGEAGRQRWRHRAPVPPLAARASFPDAGYFVVRSGPDHADQLLFDCGDLGRLGGGHGHADALSVTLSARGSHLLIDPGTFVYNRDRPLRNAFRGTAAHNTVVVDGRDQVRPTDTFRWQEPLVCRLLADERYADPAGELAELHYLAGEHDGYRHAPTGLVHRRRVLHPAGEYWLLLDDLRAAAGSEPGTDDEHLVTLPFHLAPQARVESVEEIGPFAARAQVVVDDVLFRISVLVNDPLEMTHETAGDGPFLGWVSSRYGRRQPAPVLTARFRSRAPAFAVTLLEAAERGAEPAWRTLEPLAIPSRDGAAPGLAAVVRGEDADDWVVLADPATELRSFLSAGRAGDAPRPRRLAGRAGAVWARLPRASVAVPRGAEACARLLAIDALRVAIDGDELLRHDTPRTEHRATAAGSPRERS